MNMRKTLSVLIPVIILVTSLCVYLWYKNSQFPIEYVICGPSYTNCFVSAKLRNLIDCESTKEMGDWLCDSSDPKDIKCKSAINSSTVSYCKD